MIHVVETNDSRQKYLKSFVKNIKTTKNVLVLPITGVNEDGLVNGTFTMLSELLKEQKYDVIYTGLVNDKLTKICTDNNVNYKSYLQDNKVILENAFLTSEGVISKIVELSDQSIRNSNILILGYGNCGSVLAKQFSYLDAKVSVYARNVKDILHINVSGYQVEDLSKIEKYDYIINTIPSLIVNKDFINNVNKDVLIIDIASKPGGVDFVYANSLGIKTFFYLGIPGKTSSKSAAKILHRFLEKELC